jgi:hypothetical protein
MDAGGVIIENLCAMEKKDYEDGQYPQPVKIIQPACSAEILVFNGIGSNY